MQDGPEVTKLCRVLLLDSASCCSPLLPAWLKSSRRGAASKEGQKSFTKSAVSQSANSRQEYLPERKDKEGEAGEAVWESLQSCASVSVLPPAAFCSYRSWAAAELCPLPAQQGAKSSGCGKP